MQKMREVEGGGGGGAQGRERKRDLILIFNPYVLTCRSL